MKKKKEKQLKSKNYNIYIPGESSVLIDLICEQLAINQLRGVRVENVRYLNTKVTIAGLLNLFLNTNTQNIVNLGKILKIENLLEKYYQRLDKAVKTMEEE